MMPVGRNVLRQPIAANTRDGFFACCIDFSEEQNVRVIEAAGELIHQGMSARIAMGLECHHSSAVGKALGKSFKNVSDFSRVMPVIVQNKHSASFSLHLKSSLHTRHIPQPCLDTRPVHLEFVRYGYGGERVQDIVAPWNADFDLTDFLSLVKGPVVSRKTVDLYVSRLEVGLG
jgi:hypothetical protein